jgi:hypothetical protein
LQLSLQLSLMVVLYFLHYLLLFDRFCSSLSLELFKVFWPDPQT